MADLKVVQMNFKMYLKQGLLSILEKRGMALKYRIVLVIVGLLIVLMGLYPMLSGFSFMQSMKGLPVPGNAIYQAGIILLGVIAIGYGFQGTGQKKMAHMR